MKDLVILVIVASTPCLPSIRMEVHCKLCRLSADKKGRQVSLFPSLPGNGEFCTFDFEGTVETTEWLDLINGTLPSGCIIQLAEQPARQ